MEVQGDKEANRRLKLGDKASEKTLKYTRQKNFNVMRQSGIPRALRACKIPAAMTSHLMIPPMRQFMYRATQINISQLMNQSCGDKLKER